MNPKLLELKPYPFEKLRALLQNAVPPPELGPILWSVGEPKHPVPEFVAPILNRTISGLSTYPLTAGEDDLREAIVDWLVNRFHLPPQTLNKDSHVLPCNGTREALFAFAQAVVDAHSQPLVLMPNPFYQIYEGAALLAGAKPYYINLSPDTLLPDFKQIPESIWAHCQLLYICTPGNPSGAVMKLPVLQELIELSDKFDFVIASDECYAEIYMDEARPPAGLLEAAAAMNRLDYRNCIVFHSLSKRSSLPGMRSGFMAGDAHILEKVKLFRTYHGCAMSPPFQKVSAAAWRDEEHVRLNRHLYRQKFEQVVAILSECMSVICPEGSFYLWADTEQSGLSDTEFVRRLYISENLTVLPGSFLSREAHGINPGRNRVRMALVAPLEECMSGAERLKRFITSTRKSV